MVKIGDKINYTRVKNSWWNGSTVIEVLTDGDVRASQGRNAIGVFYPGEFEVIKEVDMNKTPESMTDQELADTCREQYKQRCAVLEEMEKRKFKMVIETKRTIHLSTQPMIVGVIKSITKTETTSL